LEESLRMDQPTEDHSRDQSQIEVPRFGAWSVESAALLAVSFLSRLAMNYVASARSEESLEYHGCTSDACPHDDYIVYRAQVPRARRGMRRQSTIEATLEVAEVAFGQQDCQYLCLLQA
jgi:hypothetical protein